MWDLMEITICLYLTTRFILHAGKGFWGWKCQSYFYYLLGMCTPKGESQTLAGEDCRSSTRGLYFINTNAASPFATGRIPDSENYFKSQQRQQQYIAVNPVRNVDPFQREIDVFGKLEGNFNNLLYSRDKDPDDFYFTNHGSNSMTHNFINRLRRRSSHDVNDILTKFKKPSRPNSRYDSSSTRTVDSHYEDNEIFHSTSAEASTREKDTVL